MATQMLLPILPTKSGLGILCALTTLIPWKITQSNYQHPVNLKVLYYESGIKPVHPSTPNTVPNRVESHLVHV